ncbi:MAG: sigma-70 family RNA polymerase sigma factor [Phenylobacterium sp.]|uniref:sigma-70 family RNA polymerase sigma factor n=1 Tax=Phenylobacterium sp. TaxID=1871053 RepID=UPI001208FC07|nr:sigma-70 family RNA polymerase sigma factor [Phenylobacterium sp.]TAJ74735.1 MAG: sigma-70 family RNA polymerase sigma factor [Phenylobacterium sp.]
MTLDQTPAATFSRELTALVPHMRAFARGLCGDRTAAEDLAQDGLLRAWTARSRYQPGTNLKAWVFTIMRNQFYSERRRAWRNVAFDQQVVEQTLIAVANPTAVLELDELRRAMLLLPDEQREALVLVGAAGCSYEEAAEMCGCPVGTVKSRVSRARRHIDRIMAEAAVPKDSIRPSAAMADILSQCERAGGLPLAA